MENSRKYKILICVLLIIIILLLIFRMPFGKITHGGLVPTGKVDVFDIDIYYTGVLGAQDRVVDKDGLIIETFNPIKDKEVTGRVFIDDVNGEYLYQEQLHIFENSAYEYTNKIAPGVSNVYHFVVHNSTNSKIKYNLKMTENSEYNINMKYRLKSNSKYIIGNDSTWVTAQELETAYKNLDKGLSDEYLLEWKWFDDDNTSDTIAGENMTSEYKLFIRFYFEAVDN